MMKVLFDTNIILDVMLLRKPFYKTSSLLLAEVEQKNELEGFVCATTVTTIHYLVEKVLGAKQARKKIENIISIFEITDVNRSVLESALHLSFTDYEDAILHESARRYGIEGIVTRDQKDFKNSTIKIFEPEELHKIISSKV